MESVVIALLLIASLALGVTWLVFWALRQVGSQRSKEVGRGESVAEIEQAVSALIDRLTSTADDCLSRLQTERRRIESLLGRAPSEASEDAEAAPKPSPQSGRHPAITSYLEAGGASHAAQVHRLADESLDEATIARDTGISRDEVRLMLALRAARS